MLSLLYMNYNLLCELFHFFFVVHAPGLAGPHSQLTFFIHFLMNIVWNFSSTEDKTMD